MTDPLEWLGSRKKGAASPFTPGRWRATVNKGFAEPFTEPQDGDELVPVPTSPTAPAAPHLL